MCLFRFRSFARSWSDYCHPVCSVSVCFSCWPLFMPIVVCCQFASAIVQRKKKMAKFARWTKRSCTWIAKANEKNKKKSTKQIVCVDICIIYIGIVHESGQLMQSHNAQSHVVAFFVWTFDLNQYVRRMQIDEFSLAELTSNAVPLLPLCYRNKRTDLVRLWINGLLWAPSFLWCSHIWSVCDMARYSSLCVCV